MRTELRLVLCYRGWEYTILKRDTTHSEAGPEQTIRLMVRAATDSRDGSTAVHCQQHCQQTKWHEFAVHASMRAVHAGRGTDPNKTEVWRGCACSLLMLCLTHAQLSPGRAVKTALCRNLMPQTAEFMGSDPLMAALGLRISLIAYPVVALRKVGVLVPNGVDR